jgi:glycine/D-amino acid oxidase-like deaminating enzyme
VRLRALSDYREKSPMHDAIVIGGGFYGAVIAIYLTTQRGLSRVILVEREQELCRRASYNNQARVHNGYHYPRSLTTALRSRVNLPRFLQDYSEAVKTDFIMLYAVARQNSKVNAQQFKRFCQVIGAKLEPAPPPMRALFEARLVEDVFLVEEYAFDATRLASWLGTRLATARVEVRYGTRVTKICRSKNGLVAECQINAKSNESLTARFVFNCTYSELNQFTGDFSGSQFKLKHEITEIALVEAPPALKGVGATLMDGSFFSIMPFPARSLHSLTHVRYTPHCCWPDMSGLDPYKKLHDYARETRMDRMLRDAARYLPAVRDARYVDSLFEVKTLLAKNEGDDGRPILFEKHSELPGCYSILGGKLDNIYDVIEKLDVERFFVD